MVNIYKTHNEAINNSKVIGIVTEWDEFIEYNWEEISQKSNISVVDGRNILGQRLNNINNIKYFKL